MKKKQNSSIAAFKITELVADYHSHRPHRTAEQRYNIAKYFSDNNIVPQNRRIKYVPRGEAFYGHA